MLALQALILILSALGAVESRSAEISTAYLHPHTIGFNTGLYHNRFIDNIVSPVVYTNSSPLFEFSYCNMNNIRRHNGYIKFGFYTASLSDVDVEDNFEISGSDGSVYTIPRSLHQLDGSLLEVEYEYLRRIFVWEQGKSAFHLGGSAEFYAEEFCGLDHWHDEFEWKLVKTWVYDFSLALEGKLERRFRESDHLSVDLSFALISLVSRAPYYYAVGSREDVSPFNVEYSWMIPTDFMRWSAQFSYVFWLNKSLGLEAYYRFQYRQVTEPRDLKYISNTFSLGVKYAI